MAVLTYGTNGPHALDTYFHARIKTASLGFDDPPPGLRDQLARHGLLLDGTDNPANWERYAAVWTRHTNHH